MNKLGKGLDLFLSLGWTTEFDRHIGNALTSFLDTRLHNSLCISLAGPLGGLSNNLKTDSAPLVSVFALVR